MWKVGHCTVLFGCFYKQKCKSQDHHSISKSCFNVHLVLYKSLTFLKWACLCLQEQNTSTSHCPASFLSNYPIPCNSSKLILPRRILEPERVYHFTLTIQKHGRSPVSTVQHVSIIYYYSFNNLYFWIFFFKYLCYNALMQHSFDPCLVYSGSST